jgi:hypothetical protein
MIYQEIPFVNFISCKYPEHVFWIKIKKHINEHGYS